MMTAQFIFTILFILVSHGMELSSNPEDKQFPSGDYVIVLAFYFQNGFGDHEDLGREVHIQKNDKPSPKLILQEFKKAEQKTRPISTRLMNGKTRLFVGSKFNSILDTIVYEEGTPQLVIWKLIAGKAEKSFLVLAKKEPNLPSFLNNKEWLSKVKKLTQNLTPYDGWTHEDPENVNETSSFFEDNQFKENLDDSFNQESTYSNCSPQILKRDYLKEDTEETPVKLIDEKEIPTFDFSNGQLLAKEQNFKEQMNKEIKRNSCRLCDGYICAGQPIIGNYEQQQGHAICLAGYGGKTLQSLGNRLYNPNFVPRNKAKVCDLCNGAIKHDQLHIHNSSIREHAICASGFCGYEDCYQNNIFRDNRPTNELQKAILSEFEALPRYYCMGQPNNLLDKLKQRGAPFENVEDVLECIETLCFDLHSYNFFKKNGPPLVIHRKHWKEPKDVDWKTYIVEILKRRPILPVVEFSYNPRRGEEFIVPPGLLRFIQQCTQFLSFEEALNQIDEVEVFYCGKRGKCMRLKQTADNQDLPKTTESRSQEQNEDFCDHTHWFDNPPENTFRLHSIWTDDDWYHCTEAQDDDCFLPNIDYELDEQTKKKYLGNVLDDDEDPEFPQIRVNKTNANPKSNKKGK